jgi:hypothetical protein
MLVIRNDQIQQFIASSDEELNAEVVKAVRYAIGDRVAPYDDATLEKMVAIGIERARANKFTAAEDIAAFVAIMFEVAPRFDEQQEVRAMLDAETFPLGERLARLFDMTIDPTWLDAERRYDDSFWFPDATA